MAISFTCPHCGSKTEVADQYAGKSGPCASCGQTITIPGPGAAASGTSKAVIVVIVLAAILFGGLCLCGVGTALLLPAVQSAREAARRTTCLNNLRQISIAMQMYEATHGSYPPAFVADANGKPLYSWRVLLLPYLENQHLFAQFKRDEAWDSPTNRKVMEQMPAVFRCPSDPAIATGGTRTNYVVVVGPETLFPGATSVEAGDVRDGMSNTIMIVELQGDGVEWTAPNDLLYENMKFTVNAPGGNAIGSKHAGKANVAFADGSVRVLDESLAAEQIQRLLLINDGKPVELP